MTGQGRETSSSSQTSGSWAAMPGPGRGRRVSTRRSGRISNNNMCRELQYVWGGDPVDQVPQLLHHDSLHSLRSLSDTHLGKALHTTSVVMILSLRHLSSFHLTYPGSSSSLAVPSSSSICSAPPGSFITWLSGISSV